MLRRYNIALIPTENSEQFVNYAATIACFVKPDKYVLGKQSIPHVTLCQFEIEEDKVANIWEQVSQLTPQSIALTFNKRRSKIYPRHRGWSGVCWVSLIPDQLETLKEIHLAVAKRVKNPINASFDEYDPHMTLLNSCDESQSEKINKLSQINPALQEKFIIVLGLSDDVGQLQCILYKIC